MDEVTPMMVESKRRHVKERLKRRAGGGIAIGWILFSSCGFFYGAMADEGHGPTAGMFNLRVVSDSMPDWSSRDNFVYSALSRWKTDAEKARAQFLWSYRCRRVGLYAPEDQKPVLDPIHFFNSYGLTYCSMISSMNCALWEAWGMQSRCIDLPGHVVAEVFYDGTWHMYDNDFFNYFLNEKGVVAAAAEIGGSRVHGNVKDLKPGEFYIFDHCPTASSPRGRVFMGPSSATLQSIAKDWYPAPEQVQIRTGLTGGEAGFRYVLGVRRHESYTRYWKPLGLGPSFARPLTNNKDPMEEGSLLKNSRSNGEWQWMPDLHDSNCLFAAENIEYVADGLRPQISGRPAAAVFRVMAGNAITAARINLAFSGEVDLLISGNGGLSWSRAGGDKSAMPAKEWTVITDPVAGRIEYLVKVELLQHAVLKNVAIKTVTQVNPLALPALRLGRNEVVVVSDDNLETMTFRPRLADGAGSGEVYRISGWLPMVASMGERSVVQSTGKAELILSAKVPRDIRKIRMAGTCNLVNHGLTLDLSVNNGESWSRVGDVVPTVAPGGQRFSCETNGLATGVRSVLMRYMSVAAGELAGVFAEVGYESTGTPMPVTATYCWSEHRDGKWIERSHTEWITNVYHKYVINVGGDRPPAMKALELGSADNIKPGYSDGDDVGGGAGRSDYELKYGALISTNCAYTISRPASVVFPDTNGRLLTDGLVGLASFWGLDNIDVAKDAKRNVRRVGELVVWEAGDPVTVVIDLGHVRPVGGVRICAVQPNEKVLYPGRMTAAVSQDAVTYTAIGEARWEDCFFPPVNEPPWEGADALIYEALPAGGRIDYEFVVVSEPVVTGRYVRVMLDSPTDKRAGMALWEIQVFDALERLTLDNHIALPEQKRGL